MNQWKYVKLGEVCTIERGGSPRPIDDFITTDENGINWIKIGDADESMYITKTAQRIKPVGMKKSRYVKPGDFLLSNSMSFGRPYILKIDGCIHDGWLVLRDENNVFDKKFLYYYLSAPITYKRFKSMAVGGVVNNLNSDMVRKVRVPIPSQEEQHQISDRLDKVSNLIFLRKQQLAKLDELVKARFVEMFETRKYPIEKLGRVCEKITDGTHKTPTYLDSGIRFISAKNIIDGKVDLTDTKYISKNEYQEIQKRCQVEIQDILLTKSGTLGMPAIIRTDCALGLFESLAVIKYDRSKLLPYFLYEQLRCNRVQRQFKAGTKGVAVKHLHLGVISDIDIIVPPISFQLEFSDFAEQVDKQKQTVQRSLEKLELMKKALMQEYFG